MRPKTLLLQATLFLTGVSSAAEPSLTKEQTDFFESKIRPILSETCYKCHSEKEGKSKGGLTLDTRDALRKGGDDGPVIVPGKPGESALIKAVTYDDPDLQMPPKGEKLTDKQIADLTQWVKMGAPDPRAPTPPAASPGLGDKARAHWAFQPVKAPAVPAVENREWNANPIDAFVFKKLKDNGLEPNPVATRETLIRRASFDLTGLPPTTEEVAAFLRDTSPGAFERVVDRLLASPHYGERWGRHWLDTARYSDTVGGDNKKGGDYRYPYAWTYRDWVVHAFNQDLPYDQFIKAQLAADLLPGAPKMDLAALGLLTVGERFQNANDTTNDRIDVIGKGFLGLTVSCARCHDHRFDPISMADYYSLHGIISSTLEPAERPVIFTPSATQLADFNSKLEVLEATNRTHYYKAMGKVLEDIQGNITEYLMASRFGKDTTAEQVKEVNQLMAKSGVNRDLLRIFTRVYGRSQAVFGPFRRLAELPEKDFPAQAAALIEQFTKPLPERPAGTKAKFDKGALARKVNPLVVQAFTGARPQNIREVAEIYGKIYASLGKRREAYFAAAAASKNREDVPGFTDAEAQLIEVPFDIEPAGALNTNHLRFVIETLPNQFPGRNNFNFAAITDLLLTHPGAPVRVMSVADAATPKDSRILLRGEVKSPGPEAPRRFLEILSPDKKEVWKEGSGRLQLANAIASPSNPLTARVAVNRIWMHHFGAGFVPTPDDLGNNSEKPSHPELLDYLASRFVNEGWSFKAMHRLILTSRAWQQSSETDSRSTTADPANRFVWRANVRRMDFESVRDSLLVYSGQLDGTVGGRPVNLAETPYSRRRAFYGFIDRGNLPDIMQAFDFSNPDMPNSARSSTVVPQQALFFMNSPMVTDTARKIVERPEVAKAANDQEKLAAIYRVILQRAPTAREFTLGLQFVKASGKDNSIPSAAEVEKVRKRDEQRRNDLKKRGGDKAAPITPGIIAESDPLTPWEELAQVVLMSNESSYVN